MTLIARRRDDSRAVKRRVGVVELKEDKLARKLRLKEHVTSSTNSRSTDNQASMSSAILPAQEDKFTDYEHLEVLGYIFGFFGKGSVTALELVNQFLLHHTKKDLFKESVQYKCEPDVSCNCTISEEEYAQLRITNWLSLKLLCWFYGDMARIPGRIVHRNAGRPRIVVAMTEVELATVKENIKEQFRLTPAPRVISTEILKSFKPIRPAAANPKHASSASTACRLAQTPLATHQTPKNWRAPANLLPPAQGLSDMGTMAFSYGQQFSQTQGVPVHEPHHAAGTFGVNFAYGPSQAAVATSPVASPICQRSVLLSAQTYVSNDGNYVIMPFPVNQFPHPSLPLYAQAGGNSHSYSQQPNAAGLPYYPQPQTFIPQLIPQSVTISQTFTCFPEIQWAPV